MAGRPDEALVVHFSGSLAAKRPDPSLRYKTPCPPAPSSWL